MEDIKSFGTISEYNQFYNNDTLHPLVGIVDYAKGGELVPFTMRFNFYVIMLKDVKCGELKYGRNTYDYQEDTLAFIAPGQILRFIESNEVYQPKGQALVFHADLLRGTNLGRTIDQYTFFDYIVNEALHISKSERELILDCLKKIQLELKNSIDKHSRILIAGNIELLLNYCNRFYDRQFMTREIPNTGIMEEFEHLLKVYYDDNQAMESGLPSVSYFADQLHLSPNYFGDLIKKTTGQSAHEYILSKILNVAKNMILDTQKSVKEVSYELGFKYPQHFIRFFKSRTGNTPNEYRSLN